MTDDTIAQHDPDESAPVDPADDWEYAIAVYAGTRTVIMQGNGTVAAGDLVCVPNTENPRFDFDAAQKWQTETNETLEAFAIRLGLGAAVPESPTKEALAKAIQGHVDRLNDEGI